MSAAAEAVCGWNSCHPSQHAQSLALLPLHLAAGVKKPHRYRPGTVALREIRKCVTSWPGRGEQKWA